MKHLFTQKVGAIAALCFLFLFSFNGFAQVGINTTTPNGILEIYSTTAGVVLPRLALTRTDLMAPATNPQNGNIPTGTVVYNTNITTDGIYSVYPGIYVWVVDKWVPQFTLNQAEVFKQVGFDFMTESDKSLQEIELTGTSFTSNYTGIYKVEVSVNWGGGYLRAPNYNGLNVAAQSGTFRFTFDGVDYDIPVKSYSSRYRSGGGIIYSIWRQKFITLYLPLVRDANSTFSLRFSQDPSPEFVNNGNWGDGRGNVGDDIPCFIEITYIGEQ